MNRSRALQRFSIGLFALTGGLAAGFAGCGGGSSGTTSTGATSGGDSTTSASSTATSGTGGSGGADSTTAAGSTTTAASSSAAGTGGGSTGPCAGCSVVAELPQGSAPYGLEVDANNVYWTNAGATSGNPPVLGSVMQAKKDGTGAVTLAKDEDTPYAVHVANGFVYWISYSVAGVLRKTPIGGGAVTDLVEAPTSRDFAIGTTHIWWTREPDDIQRVPIDGIPLGQDGGGIDLLTGNPLSNGIAADATSIYWVNKQDGYIKRADPDFANETPLATGDIPWDISVDATSMYWSEQGSSPNSGKIMKASKIDGTSGVTIAMGQGGPHGIAIDATNVYWANKQSGEIVKAPLAGGASTVLAKGQLSPENIAVDATHVYWTDPKADLVVRVLK